jgi:hypothetical protein
MEMQTTSENKVKDLRTIIQLQVIVSMIAK